MSVGPSAEAQELHPRLVFLSRPLATGENMAARPWTIMNIVTVILFYFSLYIYIFFKAVSRGRICTALSGISFTAEIEATTY